MGDRTTRLVLTDIMTGRVAGEIPIVDGGKVNDILNSPGSVEASIPLNTTTITNADITPWKTAMYIMKDKTVLGSAIIQTHDPDIASNKLTLRGEGWHAWARGRLLKEDLHQQGIDQHLIVKALIDYAQNVAWGDVGINTSYITACGVVRDRNEYFGWKRHSIGKLIEDLAAVNNGFNFRYRSRINTDITTELKFITDLLCMYPTTGRRTTHIFQAGENCNVTNIKIDGSDYVNRFEALGSGQTSDAPIVAAVETSHLNVYPLVETAATYSDVIEQSTLLEKAQASLSQRKTPTTFLSLSTKANFNSTLAYTSYDVGDRVRVKAKYGLIDIDADYLITQKSLDIKTEDVALTVVPIEVVV